VKSFAQPFEHFKIIRTHRDYAEPTKRHSKVSREDSEPAEHNPASLSEIERLREEFAAAERRIAELAAELAAAHAAGQAASVASHLEVTQAQEVAQRLRGAASDAAAVHLAAVTAGRADLAASATTVGQLEKIIAERTAEMESMQATLVQSQKMEAVGQLTGGLAHDFNNLLTGITGSLELLQIRLAQGRINELERYITSAQGAARRASTLTHRLLAFSRRQRLDPKLSDINRLVTGMEDLIRRTMGPPIEIEIVAAVGLWSTLIDPGQLENALLNLCINARDAMPDGGHLTIETANRWLDRHAARERDVPPGQYVSLCVTDDGAGMSAEVAVRAFDPFYTTKPIGERTGLGLSMIYGFVRQSGGQARIYSELDKGTMVCLYLPRPHETAEVIEEPEMALAEPAKGEAGAVVLVVDDEPSVRMLVSEVLGELGYATIEAADGESAIRTMQSIVRIDLLITDVGLPHSINGRQVADAGRVVRPELKVLFITGYAENAVVRDGHLTHDMHVMMKPFALQALASRVQELIAPPSKPKP
jgi:signal transduction histidine kinase